MAEFNPGWEPTLDGLEGNMMAQPRVFGHDAKGLTAGTGAIAGTGKRGALRIIYYWDPADSIYMLFPYRKAKQEDLTPDQLKLLRRMVGELLS